MKRLFRLSFLMIIFAILFTFEGFAANVQVSGEIAPGHVRIFCKDSTYIFNRELRVYGTLIIEPGTTVKFQADGGKLVIEAGGRVIADGGASTTYKAKPNGIDPIATPGSSQNPYGFTGYADLNYFLYKSSTDQTINVTTKRDVTVHPDKEDYIFNVILNKSARRIEDLTSDMIGTTLDANTVKISFEKALMFYVSRLEIDPEDDINLNIRPWQRLNYKTPVLANDTIHFIGTPVGDFSREWGHIVVLPGARAAFFRQCSFENFRKDTTVDRGNYYSNDNLPGLTPNQLTALNESMKNLSNGGGGAITTFSSRTWLLSCDFINNMARLRGGALQILQAPAGFPESNIYDLGYYDVDKNPNITNRDASPSDINANNPIPKIDMIDEPGYVESGGDDSYLSNGYGLEPMTDFDRQAYDDGRLALYLGRMRNLKFDQNKVQLAKVVFTQDGNNMIVEDDFNTPADYPLPLGNTAFGGAVYMAGREMSEDRKIEVGFGVNNSIKIEGSEVKFKDNDSKDDTFIATGNGAENYQDAASSEGARGGAVYVGRYTSLIVAGLFSQNRTYTKYLQDANTGTNSGYFSMGGAIFSENTLARLQVRGGPERDNIDNATYFYQNTSGAGGAIFVDGNTDPQMSPILGGSDAFVKTRDYGFNVIFRENTASCWGGAVYSKRNMAITGSGGVVANELIGYGGKYPVRFLDNKSGYGGGALYISIPTAIPVIPDYQRIVQIIRAEFRGNTVGEGIADLNKPEIRGGGAIYTLNGDLNLVKGVEFTLNKLYNGNGGAICMVNPLTSTKRYFLTDVDQVHFNSYGVADDYISSNDVFTFKNVGYPADQRMMTRFMNNTISVDQAVLETQSGSGTTQLGVGTLGTTASLFGTTWLDNNTGFAVGFNGTIVKFTLAGSKWTYQTSNTNYRLNTVYYTSANVGFAAGDRGLILKTTNGGVNWIQYQTPTSQAINSIYFVGTNVGFAVCQNGYVLKTINGGTTWTMTQPQTADLKSVFFTTNNDGFIVGERGLILRTTNGGSDWNVQFVPGTIVNFNKIMFVDATIGYIAGNAGIVVKTTNGGNSWIAIDAGTNKDIYSLYFTSNLTGYGVGNFGLLIKTMDGGATWTTIDPGTSYTLNDIFFPSRDVGYIAGEFGMVLGTTNAGVTWNKIRPADESKADVTRLHQEVMLPENGVGLGGAIYVLDSVTVNRIGRQDSIKFNRVRIQNNEAYTGAAIYSDNFDLKLIFNRSLITGNKALTDIGTKQNAVTGPVVRDNNGKITFNNASHDLTSAIIYGEIQGPLPYGIFSEAANSIYDNNARFLIRLPDAPNTKGVLAGTTGIGFGGTDTLRGNYWGHTDANIELSSSRTGFDPEIQETFFVDFDDATHLKFLYQKGSDPRNQGPFEYNGRYTYNPIPLKNDAADENVPDATSIPEKLVMSGLIYDVYDKHTDIKSADYSKRRMSPIEDFAVGIPPVITRYQNVTKPSYTKYVKRWVRDPFIADSMINNVYVYPVIHQLQDEFKTNLQGDYVHPIGYPLFLEDSVDYSGLAERSNYDPQTKNESVFFVINENTGDFIRVNAKEVSENAPYRGVFRARVELVPDSTERWPNSLIRRTAEGLLNLGTGDYLLRQLDRDPYKEDKATLPGRKYNKNYTLFGNVPNLFMNRDQYGIFAMPTSNQGQVTYFGGERFGALPVDTGDVVRVISRTVLWREGVIPAYDDGISFKVVRSTDPPVYTGNVVNLQTDTIIKIVPSDFPSRTRDTIKLTEFLNTIFVTEDRTYPQDKGFYSGLSIEEGKGRDSIMTVTAIDSSNFYDPRSLLYPDLWPELTYEWKVGAWTGLYRWLQCDTIASTNNNFQLPRDNANGYILFRGNPLNPYVVPGGEEVTVKVKNYPPHYRTLDSLLALDQTHKISDDYISKFINLFPQYLFAPVYDNVNARYLQQDTIDIAGSNGYMTTEYKFRLFVVDSKPEFREPGSGRQEVFRPINTNHDLETDPWVVYEESIYTCDQTPEGKLKANLTNKLRFQADFTTDDECEDRYSNMFGRTWDFAYGKTSYGFMNIAIRPFDGDTTVIDTTVYDGNLDGKEDEVVITQVRPYWMKNNNLVFYGQDTISQTINIDRTTDGVYDLQAPLSKIVYIVNNDTTKLIRGRDTLIVKNYQLTPYRSKGCTVKVLNEIPGNQIDMIFENDEYKISVTRIDDNNELITYTVNRDNFARDFTSEGKINIRVDSADAVTLLTPPNAINGNMNLDTVFTIVVNDGHGGLNYKSVQVYINVAPLITTASLPPAKEDIDYNPDLLDESKMIKCTDPNFDQKHLWELIYAGDSRDDIPRDPCYPEAGNWDIRNLKTTPGWLKINPESGLLYGMPGVKDAPRDEMVTILCTDEYGLTYVKTLPLRVDSTNHWPNYLKVPEVICIDKGGDDTSSVIIRDKDLMRGRVAGDPTETLTITVLEPSNGKVTVSPTTISGIKDSEEFTLQIIYTDFDAPRQPDGKVIIRIKITDASGAEKILEYRVKMSDPTDFVSTIRVENFLGAWQDLQWGTAPRNASTGDGSDGNPIGELNENLCEYELPPLPPIDVFDARWGIPQRNGTLRDIYLQSPNQQEGGEWVYRAKIQAGGEDYNTSPAYPITLSWDKSIIPDKNDATRNPAGSTWYIRDAISNGNYFNVNMRAGSGQSVAGVAKIETAGNICKITILSNVIFAFNILQDFVSDVQPIAGLPNEAKIYSASPNPYSNGTVVVNYGLPKDNFMTIDVIDVYGNIVTTIANGEYQAGYQSIIWNARDMNGNLLPNGSYTLRLNASGAISVYKMVIAQ